MKSFLAKPDQTYAEHLQYVYSAWQQTIAAKQHLIERIAQQYDFSYHDFVKASLLTIAFHDIGKMIMPFQEMMEAIRTDTPFNVKRNYRHELVSLLYVLEQLTQRQWAAYKPLILLGALAVAGHHRALNSDLTSFERERVSNQPQRIHDGITEAFSLAEALFRSEGWSLSPNVNEAIESADPYKTLAQVTSGLHKFVDQEGPERSRTVYALLKGILHYADWHGSGMAPVHYTTDVGSAEVIQHIRDRCREKGIHYGAKAVSTGVRRP